MSLLCFVLFFLLLLCQERQNKKHPKGHGHQRSVCLPFMQLSKALCKEGLRTEKLPHDASTITSRTVLSPVPHPSPQYGWTAMPGSSPRLPPRPLIFSATTTMEPHYSCVCGGGGRWIFISNYSQPLHSLPSEDGSPR